MHLRDFYDYKNRLFEDVLTDEEIVKLIDADVDPTHPEELVWKNIYPLEYIPDVAEEGRVIICCDVDVQKSYSKGGLIYSPTLTIWIFVHKSLLQLPTGGVRTDELCHLIDEKINGSRFYTLGKLDLYSVKRFAPMIDWNGKVLVYTGSEVNRVHNPKEVIPSNRKVW